MALVFPCFIILSTYNFRPDMDVCGVERTCSSSFSSSTSRSIEFQSAWAVISANAFVIPLSFSRMSDCTLSAEAVFAAVAKFLSVCGRRKCRLRAIEDVVRRRERRDMRRVQVQAPQLQVRVGGSRSSRSDAPSADAPLLQLQPLSSLSVTTSYPQASGYTYSPRNRLHVFVGVYKVCVRKFVHEIWHTNREAAAYRSHNSSA